MKRLSDFHPYIVGILVGFLTIPAFTLGFNAGFGRFPFLGDALMAIAILLWPVLILAVLLMNNLRKEPKRKQHWYRALFLPPIGAVLSLFFLALLYTIMG